MDAQHKGARPAYYLYASQARKGGEVVSGFVVETADGVRLALLLWGQLRADGVDSRGAELIGPKPLGRCPLSIEQALWLRAEAALLEFRELPGALRALATEMRRQRLARRGIAFRVLRSR